MNKAIQLYQQTRQLTPQSKQLDAQVLAQICFALERAMESRDAFALNQVCGDCRLVWVTIRGLMLDEQHPYPQALKQSLLQLAETVLNELQQDPAEADLSLVLQISQELVAGLSA